MKLNYEDSERRNREVWEANKHNVALCNQMEADLIKYENEIATQKSELLIVRKELEKAQKDLTKKETEYSLIDFPSMPLREIEERIKIIDKATVHVIIEYLKLDNYELVKNLAKVTNSENAGNIIAYRDGAIGRNDALISRLSGIKSIETYKDRIEGKEKDKKQ